MISLLSRLEPSLMLRDGSKAYIGDKISIHSPHHPFIPNKEDIYWILRKVDVIKGTVFISFKEERGGFTMDYGQATQKYYKHVA